MSTIGLLKTFKTRQQLDSYNPENQVLIMNFSTLISGKIKFLGTILFLLLFIIPFQCNAQLSPKLTYNIGGYWSDWTISIYKAHGNYANFVLYCDGSAIGRYNHPSVFDLRITISNYQTPDKRTIKQHKKNKEWYVYNGTVEYWVCDEYPTIESVLRGARSGAYPFIPNPDSFMEYKQEWGRRVKRTANATIKIAPYDKYPRVYNLFFDNVGIGIEIR